MSVESKPGLVERGGKFIEGLHYVEAGVFAALGLGALAVTALAIALGTRYITRHRS